MQKVRAATMRWSLRVVDAGVITATFALTAWLREYVTQSWMNLAFPGPHRPADPRELLQILVLVLPVWMLALHAGGAYGALRLVRKDILLIRVARAVGTAVLVLLGVLFVVQPTTATSRVFLLSFAALNVVTLFATRLVVRLRPPSGEELTNLLVVGTVAEAAPLLAFLRRHPDSGLRVVGVIRPVDEPSTSVGGVRVLGTLTQLPEALGRESVAQVFMTGHDWTTAELRQVADACEELGVTFTMDANFLGLSAARAEVHDFEGWNVLSFSSTPTDADALVVKRAMDLVGALIGLVIFAPVLVLTAIAIKLEDGGPVLFVQERSGLYGRVFPMIKFRSMVTDAEGRKAALEGRNEMSGPVFKMASDPRVTRVGAFLRKTSIDELPQLWNVMRGEMSLVGPRPPLPSEVARYARWQMRRLSMKPGLTCIWQVSGRNQVDFDTWMKLDLQYIDNWSLVLDLELLLRTVPAVLSGSGAR